MGILDAKVREVINPKTRRRDYWSEERIEAYEINYGTKIKDAPKKRVKKPKTVTNE